MTNKKKPAVLITGAGGLLGHALCQAASDEWTVTGIFQRQKPAVNGLGDGRWIQMDLTDTRTLRGHIKNLKPRAIIHAAAVPQVARCQAEPEQTERINVMVPVFLAGICAEFQIPLVFTSTDLVFDGRHAPYDEESLPRPLNRYGDQKARAETQVLQCWPRTLVCRLPLLIGATPSARTNFTVQMLAAIADDRPVTLFSDEFRTPVDIWSAARGIFQFLGRQSGLLHLGGRTRVSRYDIGVQAARFLGKALTMIQSVPAQSLPGAELRAPDCALNSRKAFGLGYAPDSMECAMRRTIDQFQTFYGINA